MEAAKKNPIKLIVGLGNPGEKYARTRHNVGFMAVSSFANEHKAMPWQNKFKGLYTNVDIAGEKIYLLMPQTFMNLSGESVVPLMQFFKILPTEVLVIHDELDVAFGKMMFKKGGGLAGHNGLRSIAACCGTPDFFRLRLGIDRPVKGEVLNWVLGPYSNKEEADLESILAKVNAGLEFCVKQGWEKAANKYNKADLLLK